MAKSEASTQPGRPGRRPSLNTEHTAVLRAITQEQPRSSLDEVTWELLHRTGVKVNAVIVRKALREAGIERLHFFPFGSFDATVAWAAAVARGEFHLSRDQRDIVV